MFHRCLGREDLPEDALAVDLFGQSDHCRVFEIEEGLYVHSSLLGTSRVLSKCSAKSMRGQDTT
ncbi:MAG: hypothetical protein ACYSU4_19195 [Planctomycetota bacterium]